MSDPIGIDIMEGYRCIECEKVIDGLASHDIRHCQACLDMYEDEFNEPDNITIEGENNQGTTCRGLVEGTDFEVHPFQKFD